MPPLQRQDKKQELPPYKLGVNLFDLDRFPPLIRRMLLEGKIDLQTPVIVDKTRPDETALVFTVDLLTAATIIDVLRSEDRKLSQWETRAYLCREKRWQKLPSKAILTLTDDQGTLRLNPAIFGVKEYIEPEPLEVQTITLGKARRKRP